MRFVVFGLLLAVAYGAVSNENAAIDDFLDSCLESFSELDSIAIPEIQNTFKTKFGWIGITGHFKAQGGQVQGISTLQRTGNVTFDTEGNRLLVTAAMGLKNVVLTYEHYSLDSWWFLSSKGAIRATAADTNVQMALTLHKSKKSCSGEFNQIQLDSVGDFDVKLIGGHFVNKWETWVGEWLLNHYKGAIIESVNSHMKAQINRLMKTADVCSYI